MTDVVARASFDPPAVGLTFIDAELAAGRTPDSPQPLPASPRWLRQVHGASVVDLDDWTDGVAADAAWTARAGEVAIVRTADCLPVLIAEVEGGCVAAIHAGWRGLAAGVVAATVARLPARAERLSAWIGPRICRDCYEVGEDVRAALSAHGDAFAPGRPGHWQADLPAIARAQLRAAGVGSVVDSALCTACDRGLFSARHGAGPGRMATGVWIESGAA